MLRAQYYPSVLSRDQAGAKIEKKVRNSRVFLFLILENHQGVLADFVDKIRGL
jgi:hypothetical protein